MKRTTIIKLVIPVLSTIAFSSNAFEAKLHDIKIYAGDKGGMNVCEKENILITEFYKISNIELKGLVIARHSTSHKLIVKKVEYVTKEGNYIQFDICAKPNYEANVSTRFMSPDGTQSNEIIFKIDTNGKEVLPANKWGPLVNLNSKS